MITVFFRTIIIYIILIGTMRLMGKRQIGELEVSELITTFMLSELATICITDIEMPLLSSVIPILLLLSIEVILSFITMKIPFMKRAMYGKPNILINNGKIDQREMTRHRIELSELLCAARQNGTASLEDVSYAILEENGKISIFEDTELSLPLILDRRIIPENLKIRNWSEDKLAGELKKRHLCAKDIFLLSVDDSGNIYIVRKSK